MPIVRATAPCRVDLAGGTLDIWPLGLLHPGACTVNLAIDIGVRVEVAARERGYVVTSGADRVEADSIDDLLADGGARLAACVLRHLGVGPVEISMDSDSPRNAGLGASSALCVALLGACRALLGQPGVSPRSQVHVARDIEAQLMSLPTGIQDHYPAVLGGVLEIRHRVGGEEVRRLAVDAARLGESLTVVYSGRSHFSAGNNFDVIGRRLRGDDATIRAMDRIAHAAGEIGAALESADFEAVGGWMNAEMVARRELSQVVSTAEVEDVLTRAAAAGAWGAKVCGAGGGGCVAVLASPELRRALRERFEDGGYRVLPAAVAEDGLSLCEVGGGT